MDLYFGWHELGKKTAQKSQADNVETTATPRKAMIFHLVFLFELNIRQFRHENLTGWPVSSLNLCMNRSVNFQCGKYTH